MASRGRAVLEYMDGSYSLAKSIKSPYGNMFYADLPVEVQNKIQFYSFITEQFYGISDEEVLAIFARLNTNSVRLNAQELRNGKFFGEFKTACYSLSLKHLTFWRNNGLFTERGIARMLEAELTSELVIMMMVGMQDKKSSINYFYEELDEDFPGKDTIVANFQSVIDTITAALEDTIKDTEFRRIPLFYTLFSVVYDRMFGLQGLTKTQVSYFKRAVVTQAEKQRLRDAVVELSGYITSFKDEDEYPKSQQRFIIACTQQTDNIAPRRVRFDSLSKAAFG